ncbi:hypothetical protein A1O3_06879 [Capronia epimyces CBS 606.96]|uniref:NCS1 family nucleobase:cation symporter-1 n=1 Tax=Capronia epimyces CBS 606.96 TaxID=1182542 RepID=W9XJA4_9EURO|nr:uncharacterized protein A1O3_06879 [Capronia epimyces CBS 606.96]EXJ80597.1 hypothetical protein A1O3_06879 [Capronia epimyces CBS 606.96]
MVSFGRISRTLAVRDREGNQVDGWKNPDLIPLPPSRRTWVDLDFVGLWSTSFVTIFGWQAISSILSLGLNVWQAFLCNLIAKLIQVGVVLSLGWIGGQWHIGFTVSSRFTFGIWGSFLPIIIRVLLCCVWYGVQSFTGGMLVSAVLSTIFPSYQHMKNTLPASAAMTTKQFVGFVVYNIIAIPFLYVPPHKLRTPFKVCMTISALTIFSMSVGLMAAAHGAGDLVHTGVSVSGGSQLGWGWVHGITTVIGSGVVGMTSQSDFNRFARRPGNQVFGQTFAVLFFGNLVPLFGLLGTSAAGKLYGDITELGLWNPPAIVDVWLSTSYHSPKMRAASFFTSFGLLCSTLALNTVENGISGGMDFAGLLPRYFNIRRGSYAIAIIGILIQPWQIVSKASVFTAVLSSFGVILGPLIGVFTADFFIVRKRRVKLSDLYNPSPDSIYWFWHGFNWRAFVAWFLGFAPFVPGIASVNPANDGKLPIGLIQTFYTGFLTGYVIAFAIHVLLNRISPPFAQYEIDEYDVFDSFEPDEAAKIGMLKIGDTRGEDVPGFTMTTDERKEPLHSWSRA